MFLKKIELCQFKNFDVFEKEFHHKVTFILGKNGMGKTNLLDSIYFLSIGKSYFTSRDVHSIKQEQDFLTLRASYLHDTSTDKVECVLRNGQKKTIKYNGKKCKRIAEHIGRIPVVLVSPSDKELITQGSEYRRRWIDSIISQTDPKYLNLLIRYNRLIKQRNSLLKTQTVDPMLYQSIDKQLEEYAEYIYWQRKAFVELISPRVKLAYEQIAGENENISIEYKSQLANLGETSLYDMLRASFTKDVQLRYTSIGTHRDDLSLMIKYGNAKTYGSQGQQKSFTIAMRIAEYEYISEKSKKKPLLLLDDIFDKLDRWRVQSLFELTCTEAFGQTFITDTDQERVEDMIRNSQLDAEVIVLEKIIPAQAV